MIIILCLYIVALWLVFSKFKLVRWGWLSGTVSVLIGVFILATFLALFNYLTPSGRVTVTGRVVEVTPNVTGQIVAIPVKPNLPVKANDVLFQIDPAPFQYKVTQLQASLAAAKQQTEILKSNYEQATANVTGLTAQVAFNAKRNADILKLATEGANTEFQAQDRQNQYETALAQLNVAKAAQQSAKLALDSEIGGVNTTVAQIQAQLDNASWELSQTAIRAPADGYVTLVTFRSATVRCRRARRCHSLSRARSRSSECFRRTVFRPSRTARPSISFSITPRAASITQKLRQFPRAWVKDKWPCRERSRAPTRSVVQRPFRHRFPFRMK